MRIATWNIEWFANLFEINDRLLDVCVTRFFTLWRTRREQVH